MNPARLFGAICTQQCSEQPHGDLFCVIFDDNDDNDDNDDDDEEKEEDEDEDGDDDDDDDEDDVFFFLFFCDFDLIFNDFPPPCNATALRNTQFFSVAAAGRWRGGGAVRAGESRQDEQRDELRLVVHGGDGLVERRPARDRADEGGVSAHGQQMPFDWTM